MILRITFFKKCCCNSRFFFNLKIEITAQSLNGLPIELFNTDLTPSPCGFPGIDYLSDSLSDVPWCSTGRL